MSDKNLAQQALELFETCFNFGMCDYDDAHWGFEEKMADSDFEPEINWLGDDREFKYSDGSIIVWRSEETRADIKVTTQSIEMKKALESAKEIMDKTGYTICTCGNCGAVLYLKTTAEFIRCHGCMQEQEPCDCPEIFYEGMEFPDK
jgi:hypothetical protein